MRVRLEHSTRTNFGEATDDLSRFASRLLELFDRDVVLDVDELQQEIDDLLGAFGYDGPGEAFWHLARACSPGWVEKHVGGWL